MILTDTHIHLYYPDFNIEPKKLIEDAMQRGIKRFFLPNVDSQSIPLMYKLNQTFPNETFMMMGIHPCSIKENYKEELSFAFEELSKKKFYAIGEIGIDLYWDSTFLKEQQDAFEQQIEWALTYNLPFVIHCRNGFNETLEILNGIKKTKQISKFKGIFHCFSGNQEEAEQIIDMGFYLGIGGVVTFKNSGLDKIVENIDLKHIVLETDAPYLAPVPYRGKTNLPVYLHSVAEKVALLKKTNIHEVANITTKNSIDLFGI